MATLLIRFGMVLTFFLPVWAHSQGESEPVKKAFDLQHSAWTQILKTYVSEQGAKTAVHYEKLKQNPAELKAYLEELSSVNAADFKKWPKEDQMAFWINSYNAFTLQLILDHYPVKSIKDIGGFFSSPWKIRFFTLLGEKRHLDEIEHEILRKKFNEPRVHFALNCASIGCPPLRREAYRGADLSSQLQEQAKVFLNDSDRNRYDPEKKTAFISKIFDWFEEDFGSGDAEVLGFIYPFIQKPGVDVETFKSFKIKYLDYDWGLNRLHEK